MIGEIDICGAFVPTLLIWIVVALLVSLPLRWGFSRLGLYRYIWHKALFDLCVLVVLIGAVTALTVKLPGGLAQP